MAWENCYIVENQAEFLKLTSLPASPQNTNAMIHDSGYKSDLTPAVNDYNQWINCSIDVALNPNTVLFENATWKLWTTSSQLYLSKNNVVIAQFPNNPFDTTNWRYWRRSFWACIDNSTQKGVLGIAYVIQGTSYNWFSYVYRIAFTETRPNNDELVYEFLTNALPIQYTWTSVPSISGKNGILQLSQIASASINNGEAVSGASASDFDSLTAQVSTLVTDDSQIAGADAGGISGSGSNSGNQSSGYAFGQGESGTDLSGGGSGYYGGEKGGSLLSGGAGSGYIGNSLLSNKKMVGYNVPTSSAESTKTESVNDVSASAVSGKPKSGNGFVRIKYLRPKPSGGFGFHINGNGTDPDDMVTYLDDAVGKTPAHMNFSTGQFDYGSWENAFFMPKPCILGQNGVVQKYLNPNDYTKDVDGNSVVIDENLTDANVMMEFPKIWVKVEPDQDDEFSGSVWIADNKIDNTYHDWAYISKNKVHKDKFYIAAYNSSNPSNVYRSLSGTGTARSQNASAQMSQAAANGDGWFIETLAQIDLINYLLILISKSLDSQSKFGMGVVNTNGSSSTVGGFRTGQHNGKGLFYGTNTGNNYSDAVKVFGIENWWGMILKRYAGEIKNTKRYIKMCWGQEDGSTTDDFGTSNSGYIDTGDSLPSSSSNRSISKMHFISGKGFYAVEWNSDDDKRYCDRQSFGTNNGTIPMAGGFSDGTSSMGIFFRYYSSTVTTTYYTISANISYV